jgi:hypothetical protein
MVRKAKPRAKAKKQADKQLLKVPAEHVFWCHDGSIFSDINELAEGLAAMSDETFAYHSNLEKQDFSNWVGDVIGDEQLASDLAAATSRTQAAECVAAKLTILTSKIA